MASFVGLVLIVAIVVGVAVIVRNVRRSNAVGEAAAAKAELLKHDAAKARELATEAARSDQDAFRKAVENFDLE